MTSFRNAWAVLTGAVLLLGAGPVAAAEVPVDSPQEWTQYRLTPEKNPVIETDGSVVPAADGFRLPDEVRATPVVVGDRLYVGTHGSGTLHAFDLATGEQLWQAQAPNWIHSEMLVSEGTVYVGYGDRGQEREDGLRGDGPGGVLALDAETGEQKWEYTVDAHVMPTPVLHDGRIHAATGDRHLHVIDAATGEGLERVDVGAVMSMSAPAAADGMLYAGAFAGGPRVVGYDMDAREMVWTTAMPDVRSGLDDVPPAVSEGVVVTTSHRDIVPAERLEHWAHAFSADTGELLWEVHLGDGPFVPNNKSGAPAVADGVMYVGSPTTRMLYALDLRTGEELWSHDSGPIKAPPVVVDGHVVYTTTQGEIGAVDTGTGALAGSRQLSDEPLAPAGPIVVDDVLLVPGQDGMVHTLALDDLTGGSGAEETPAAGTDDVGDDAAAGADGPEDAAPVGGGVLGPAVAGLLAIGLLGALAVLLVRRRRKPATR
ncbi:PQQ-binding-like beta-propeller repeat protein [uncultured Kocuria sp.]|uniref:outer membrane protein assembly factor BamB family protein n=1 Tax=uncultured Kocuria sp. TaxID=259305 RepID=UPI00262F416C|nr:PQQ-binding-like beta-propeller repeat protein [uncultured Kocuria sp.]